MFEFEPQKLTRVLEAVRLKHPLRKGEIPPIGKTTVDTIREILQKAQYSELKNISLGFDTKALLACIEIVASDRKEDIAKKAAYVINLRPKSAMIPIVWFKLIKHYPNPVLEYILKDLIKVRGSGAISAHSKISNQVLRWLMDFDLSTGILKDHQALQNDNNFDSYLRTHFLNPGEAICRAAWEALLTRGRPQDLKKETPERIIEEIESKIESEKSMQIGRHYLNTFPRRSVWNEMIIEYIHIKWDRPLLDYESGFTENRFWKEVNSEPRREFHAWLMDREIGAFFEGERADFWRRYIKNGMLLDVRSICDNKGFLMRFNRFGVVEFKDKGNAAYVYPIQIMKEYLNLRKKNRYPISYYKNKSKTIRLSVDPSWDGRIIHREGWQETVTDKIKYILK